MTRPSRPTRSGRDFYVILGKNENGDPRWDIACEYGFLSAGGGSHFWKPLKNLTPGDRVFVYVGKAGYVGIGVVIGEMIPARDAEVGTGDRSRALLDVLDVDAAWRDSAASEDPERSDMVVKVELLESRSVDEALPASADSGLFSSPTVVCELGDKPKHRFTVSAVEAAFGLSICDRRARRP